jgi:D-alanyl-D-alanine carboxypeptidase/D-alanyl-D-alanine-endopeptidase (penicillin-binding protein 4)
MSRLASFLALVGLLLGIVSSPSHAGGVDLSARLSRALVVPGIAPGSTGALAVDLRSGTILLDRNSTMPLRPASVEKLAVTYAALRVLGPGYRFRTEVRSAGRRTGSTWHGNLVLVGGGDPSLALADVDRLARGIARTGIRYVDGRVLGDETRFDGLRGARGWKRSFLGIEAAPLSALSVAGVHTVSPDGSARAAALALKQALERRGVDVEGRTGTGKASDVARPLAVDSSAPLLVLLRHMDRESDNFYAEMLLKELGVATSARGTTAAGAAAVRRILADPDVPMTGVRIADGSGLSLDDRTTAATLVGILRAGWNDPSIGQAFVGSLAVAGMSGTLEKRLQGRLTRGRVVAKTGTTSAACSLAGFVAGRFVFAIVQNGAPVNYWAARVAQDRFVTVLARSQ